ncbi:acyl-CoA thioesterase [Salinadaptatus halalkaliphilus]|nr:thioesterase family protein [Salinadaptatus halalkaliphilus]
MHEVYENTVRFEETDAQGIVFFGNYTTYADETLMSYMDAIGYPYEERNPLEWELHVVNVDLSYHASAGVRDRLVNSMRVSSIGTSSLEFEYECRRAADDELIVSGTLTHVGVDDDGEPTPVPDDILAAIEAFQGELPTA